jgi:CheY-like chemotaxis protein
VRDEGIGIAPEMIGRIFDLFVQQPQTLDRSSGGLGLGLAIARSLVVMHGGTITAHSDGLGKGSEFVIELPWEPVPASPAAVAAPRVRTRTPGARKKRVLVVDDNEDAATTLAEALEEMGYVVELADDGPSALVKASSFQPDVALVDIGLPVMDGFEVARRLRVVCGAGKDLRLVAVTGYGQETDRSRSADAGFMLHLVKPVDLDVLSRVLER